FLIDSYLLQSFTFDKVQTYFGTEVEKPFTLSVTRDGRKVRGVPRAYDVMAHLGSPEALKQLLLDGDLDYTGYRNQLKRLDQERLQLRAPATFYNRYLSAVSENLMGTNYGNGVPNLRLTSSVGAWASLRHDVVAYAKQSYTSVGRGLAMSPPLPSRVPVMRVAPAAPVFRHLGQAIRLILPTFENESSHRQLLAGQQLLETLDLLERTAGTGPLTETDAMQLAKAIRDWAGGPPQTLIADVHTDANSNEVLEIGVGQSATLSFEDGDQDQPSKGVVFSVYEFRWPISQRLTDEAWREMLKQKAGSLRKLTFFLSPPKSTNNP
ncbi:MAG TPA: DUF3160 domain-containing protein, partial [Acidobacteriota bacterium]|nr:DUF3160 domain-containing protein [Acidobacteriota bacterium]